MPSLIRSRDVLSRVAGGRDQNRAIPAAQAIEERIELANENREAQKRGEELGLSSDDLAFYDALERQRQRGARARDTRRLTVRAAETVRSNVSIDWTGKESVPAKLRVVVKGILRKYGYRPDKRHAANPVLEQAELLSDFWTEVSVR